MCEGREKGKAQGHKLDAPSLNAFIIYLLFRLLENNNILTFLILYRETINFSVHLNCIKVGLHCATSLATFITIF